MDADEIKEEIAHQRTLQREYRKRLRVLEAQAAKFGIYVPPHIQIEIDEMNEKISDCENAIMAHKEALSAQLLHKIHICKEYFRHFIRRDDVITISGREEAFHNAYPLFGVDTSMLSEIETKNRHLFEGQPFPYFAFIKFTRHQIESKINTLKREIEDIEKL